MDSMIEKNLKNIDIIDFLDKEEENTYRNSLIVINRLITDLLILNKVSYNYQYLNNKTQSLKLQCSDLLEADEENNTIYICQYNQLGEKLTDKEEIINLIHEYLHIVAFRNYEQESDIGNLYYGFDEFCTEYITYIVCMKLGLDYEVYYKKNTAGYIDENDYEFMKKISNTVGMKVLLEIYFTGNRDLLEKTLGIDLLLNMNMYFSYYSEIYDLFNKPRKVLREILNRPIFEPQKRVLNNFIDKINSNIDSILDKKDSIDNSFRR